MILVLGALWLSLHAPHVVPSPLPGLANSGASHNMVGEVPSCTCPSDQRSLLDIVWSCLATIFICSWVSVHPNIPAADDGKWVVMARRLRMMLWAIIAPELIIFWAMGQWHGARVLARKYRGNGWTKTHGHFLQMGGFMLYEGNEPKGVLSDLIFETLLRSGRIEFPKISEAQIKDKSKGDALSKAITLLQTGWFITQCVARWVEGLKISELELVTLALAILNGVMYFLWWDKPLEIGQSVPVYLLQEPIQPTPILSQDIPSRPSNVMIVSTLRDLLRNGMGLKSFIDGCIQSSRRIPHILRSGKEELITDVAELSLSGPIGFKRGIVKPDQRRVSTFSAHPQPCREEDDLSFPIFSICDQGIAIAFGGVHLLGWNFEFPTIPEAFLWRVNSSLVTGFPSFLLITALLSNCLYAFRPQLLKAIDRNGLVPKMIIAIFYISLGIYVLARIGLLGEAFVSLRALPQGAYDTVKWTSFIPHI